MRITGLKKLESGELQIQGVIDDREFEALQGDLYELRLFSALTLSETASSTKSGARHAWTKWLLFPKSLRRRFTRGMFEFSDLRCGALLHEHLYVIFEVPRKGGPPRTPHYKR